MTPWRPATRFSVVEEKGEEKKGAGGAREEMGEG
jgi:hypothetical protein